MTPLRFSQTALADIESILEWSCDRFGLEASTRYQALILTAWTELSADPSGLGSRARPELGPNVFTRHLSWSRPSRARGVHNPRHFVLYRIDPDEVFIGRVLHDAMDVTRHASGLGPTP